MDYVPITPEDLKQIMKTIGISSMDDLFDDILKIQFETPP